MPPLSPRVQEHAQSLVGAPSSQAKRHCRQKPLVQSKLDELKVKESQQYIEFYALKKEREQKAMLFEEEKRAFEREKWQQERQRHEWALEEHLRQAEKHEWAKESHAREKEKHFWEAERYKWELEARSASIAVIQVDDQGSFVQHPDTVNNN